MSFLKQTSGAKIYISALPYTQNVQICHIEGQWVQAPLDAFLSKAKFNTLKAQLNSRRSPVEWDVVLLCLSYLL